jgi:UDP-N-acetylglucosamine 2-epimerase (non-hydrolysing)
MILICYGTRPEWLKIKPIIDKLERSDYSLLFTGQHDELAVDSRWDSRLYIPTHANNRLDSIVATVMQQFPNGFNAVLVQGDTASAFACALAAFHRGMHIVHLEAGLRTYDVKNPYPEEAYRQMISRIATHHLCPTNVSKFNLKDENVSTDHAYVVGNTSLDNIVDYRDKVTDGNTVLVTLHRRENHDIIKDWFVAIDILAQQNPNLDFVLPIHPNPNVMKWKNLLQHVRVVDPLNHMELLDILCKSTLVISDSGGIQEEASFLGKKVIVARHTTERPEGIISGHLFLCKDPSILQEMFERVLTLPTPTTPCPFGDGYAAEKVVPILRGLL